MSNREFRVRSGTATISSASRDDLAKILGTRRNAVALRRGLKIVNRQKDRTFDCVAAVELLLLQEYDRIGAEFCETAHESVATVFWHAITRNQKALALGGPPERCAQILQKRGARTRLADELTGRPSIHRYMYRASNGNVATALDPSVLKQKGIAAENVINLEAVAEKLVQRIDRPIVSLTLKSKS